MIVYHGSDSNFKKLRIAKSLIKYESTKVNEGKGIYFSTNKEVAKSYGQYIYTLEINDKYFLDFRKQKTCQDYFNLIRNRIQKELNIDITRYVDYNSLTLRMKLGGLSISGIGREIYLLLDCQERFYRETANYKIDRAYQILRGFDRKPPKAYMFEYHIKDIGVIKDVSEDIVRIIDKQQRHLL